MPAISVQFGLRLLQGCIRLIYCLNNTDHYFTGFHEAGRIRFAHPNAIVALQTGGPLCAVHFRRAQHLMRGWKAQSEAEAWL